MEEEELLLELSLVEVEGEASEPEPVEELPEVGLDESSEEEFDEEPVEVFAPPLDFSLRA